MTADEIREMRVDDISTSNVLAKDTGYKVNGCLFIGNMLQEIAAQLAELNVNLKPKLTPTESFLKNNPQLRNKENTKD